MNNPFGYPPAQWSNAKREVRDALVQAASNQTTVAYSDLASKIQAIPLDARDVRLNALIGQISEEEDASGRGMLSVVVVHKEGDQQPGQGFFELAEALGYTVVDHDVFWITSVRLSSRKRSITPLLS